MRTILLALIDDLDRLAEQMRARQSDFEDEVRAFYTRSKATTAYVASAASRKK